MRRLCVLITFALGLLGVGTVHAVTRYTDARIIEIETSEQQIHLFLEVIGGDTPPSGNGGTNLPPDRPYVMLANTAEELAVRKHLLPRRFRLTRPARWSGYVGKTPGLRPIGSSISWFDSK